MSDNYTVEFDKGMAVGEEYLACSNESRIIYSFVPRAFLNAYIQAYKNRKKKYILLLRKSIEAIAHKYSEICSSFLIEMLMANRSMALRLMQI